MNGKEKALFELLAGSSDQRLIVPIYQRNYSWEKSQCEQFFNDLCSVIKENRPMHFFGSIVTAQPSDKNAKRQHSLVIDGQQRITTFSILLTAIVNLINSGDLTPNEDKNLAARIRGNYLVDTYNNESKLRLSNDDSNAFQKIIFEDTKDFIQNSRITLNYNYFCDRLRNMSYTIDQLFEALEKLEIIDIYILKEENPQVIFESLNSTGLDLTEADKIRNFILMGLNKTTQDKYYKNYWEKIEKNTVVENNGISDFVRHYLTLKQTKIPAESRVYIEFKKYVAKINDNKDKVELYREILEDMTRYSEIYNQIKTVDFEDKEISSIICRLNLLTSVTYPFFMSLFSRYQQREVSKEDIIKSLKIIESYIFRRMICPGYNTNALNKVFCALDSQIKKYQTDKTDRCSYSDICIYILENKSGKAAFPKDDEFKKSIHERDVYNGIKKLEHRMYMFDRLENGYEINEHVEVMKSMKDKSLTIEHIMPQQLTDSWKNALGSEWKDIHTRRLHTLANLTLTGYNSEYSNHDFEDKKNHEKGFKNSGLRLNQEISQFTKWTEEEMRQREEFLVKKCLQYWQYPDTTFNPSSNNPEISLEDIEDNEALTGKKLIGYMFENEEVVKATKWVEMFKDVCQRICSDDIYPLSTIADNISKNISYKDKEEDGWYKLADKIYLYTKISNADKVRVLNMLFEAYGRDKEDLIFILDPEKEAN